MATRTKEKAAARKANADKRPQAHARYVRISPRKVKIVIDLIRGKNVDEALAILQYTPKAASPLVMKVLNSAIANAVNNQELNRHQISNPTHQSLAFPLSPLPDSHGLTSQSSVCMMPLVSTMALAHFLIPD